MNQIAVTEEFVKIEIKGLDKLKSFKGELKIPRKAIAQVYRPTSDMKPHMAKNTRHTSAEGYCSMDLSWV